MSATEVKDMNAAIKALEPVIRNVAALRKRTVPANITLDELVRVGRDAASECVQRWDGGGSLECYVGQMVGHSLNDYLRAGRTVGRSKTQAVAA